MRRSCCVNWGLKGSTGSGRARAGHPGSGPRRRRRRPTRPPAAHVCSARCAAWSPPCGPPGTGRLPHSGRHTQGRSLQQQGGMVRRVVPQGGRAAQRAPGSMQMACALGGWAPRVTSSWGGALVQRPAMQRCQHGSHTHTARQPELAAPRAGAARPVQWRPPAMPSAASMAGKVDPTTRLDSQLREVLKACGARCQVLSTVACMCAPPAARPAQGGQGLHAASRAALLLCPHHPLTSACLPTSPRTQAPAIPRHAAGTPPGATTTHVHVCPCAAQLCRAGPHLRCAHDLLGQHLWHIEVGDGPGAQRKEGHVAQHAAQGGGAFQRPGGCRARKGGGGGHSHRRRESGTWAPTGAAGGGKAGQSKRYSLLLPREACACQPGLDWPAHCAAASRRTARPGTRPCRQRR